MSSFYKYSLMNKLRSNRRKSVDVRTTNLTQEILTENELILDYYTVKNNNIYCSYLSKYTKGVLKLGKTYEVDSFIKERINSQSSNQFINYSKQLYDLLLREVLTEFDYDETNYLNKKCQGIRN